MEKIYIAGCGRSGTTLMLRLFRTFADCHVILKESPAAILSETPCDCRFIVAKRNAAAWKTLPQLDPAIKIVYMVRHPFDVLTSAHPKAEAKSTKTRWRWSTLRQTIGHPLESWDDRQWQSQNHPYYISPNRWLQEYRAYQQLRHTRNSGQNLLVLRYEELVANPDATQEKIMAMTGLQAVKSFSAAEPLSLGSMEKFRKNAEFRAYLRALPRRLQQNLNQFCTEHTYPCTQNDLKD